MQIEITGGTAEVRDKANIRVKKALSAASADLLEVLKRKYNGDIAKIKDADASEIRTDGELMDVMDDFGLRALTVLLVSWTRSEKMPTTVLEWLEWEDPDDAPNLYKELNTAITPIAYGFLGSRVEVTPEAIQDPESPTVPSFDSNEGGPDQTAHSTLLPVG